MRRRSLTPREKYAMIIAQDFKCGCGCGHPIVMEDSDGEHTLPVGLGNEEKPDSVWYRECHKRKTREDRARMAKADRQRKAYEGTKKRKGRKLQGRGFDKTRRRRMDGTVEVRDG